MITNSEQSTRPVLFFDSGIGGLTVLREARLFLPEYPFLFIVDNAAFPYGAWDENALREHLLKLFQQLIDKYNPKLCIIACNTASTLILDDLRSSYPEYSFVGTVPAIKPAAQHSESKLISVLATDGTVKRAYTKELINKYAGETEVNLVGSQKLAAIAEDYIHDRPVDLELIRQEIRPCFIEIGHRRTDIVVLACTHYPFLAPLFRNLAPWPVDWLDPAQAIAKRAQFVLHEQFGDYDTINESAEYQPNFEDYVIFTAPQAEAGFINRRLFHSFGLKISS